MINYLNNSENSVAILFVLAIISVTIPYGFPLFGIMVFLFVFLKTVTGRFKIKINVGLLFFIFAIFCYFLGVIHSEGTIYARNRVDLTNIASYFMIWVLLSDVQNYKKLMHNIAKYTSITVFFLSVFSLFKFVLYINGIQLNVLYAEGEYPSGASLTLDYNIFSFGITAGIILSLYMMRNSIRISQVWFYLITFVSGYLSIVLSGSRRGWVIASIILLLIILYAFRALLKSKTRFNKAFKISIIASYFIVMIILIGIPFGAWSNFTDINELQRMQLRFETLIGDDSVNALGSREKRWDYAKSLINEQTPFEKVFGSGFGYLKQYAVHFNTIAIEDYPHSPFYSAMLYAGLLGLLSVVLLIFYSSFKAIRKRKILIPEFVLYYFISWGFVFISGNSIFSYKIFNLVTLIILAAPIKKYLSGEGT